jgi:hypothetical protein
MIYFVSYVLSVKIRFPEVTYRGAMHRQNTLDENLPGLYHNFSLFVLKFSNRLISMTLPHCHVLGVIHGSENDKQTGYKQMEENT